VWPGFPVGHTAAGFTALTTRLARLGDPAGTPVAIERPDGRLVDALLAAGHPVVPVKPNAIKTWREGEVISGAKSDPGDATSSPSTCACAPTTCAPPHP
jgi:hypothetical protein